MTARVVIDGLVGPTQVVAGSSGELWVAQLNGGENDATGQVVVVDEQHPDRAPRVVLDGLNKPTGIAIFNEELWVMERDRLTRGPLEPNADGAGDRRVVIDNLPNNGRSQGSLTVDGDRLLFDTSGSIRNGEVVADSGRLWAVDASGYIDEVASGFKHAYAHVRVAEDVLVTTEVGDGTYDGSPPADELVVVEPGRDHGWPRCVGDNRPVAQYGATAAACSAVPRSLAVFAPGATPTSVVVAPWDDDLVLVALWNEGRVVGVSLSDPGAPDEVSAAAEHPQHLAVFGDRVLMTDHTAGTIVALSRD